MAIQKQPGKGLEVDLKDFVKLRAYQSGGEFWGHENQTVIRQYLGDFLPLMDVQQDGKTVLAQHFVDGKEVASESNPITNGIPKSERNRLFAAVAGLKAKAEDPSTDQNTQAIVKAFRLPDPDKDPELYRVYGSRFSPKLLVVWGCEKEPGTSIVPEAASAKIKGEVASAGFIRKSPWLLLILLLAALAYFGWQSDPVQERLAANNNPNSTTPASGGTDGAGGSTDETGATDGTTNTGENTSPNGEATGENTGKGLPGKASPSSETAKSTGSPGSPNPGGSPGNDASNANTNPSIAVVNPTEPTDPSDPIQPTEPEENDPALGTPISPDKPLMVQEVDPESDDPKDVQQRPADSDLVNLAKITRSAVALIAVTDEKDEIVSTGSGFVISPKGLIVTNHHVIDEAHQVLAKMANGDVYSMGNLIASDAKRDLAVFKIDPGANTLPYLSLDQGPDAEVGENIAVVGSPLGLEGTFSIGIVSSTRENNGISHLQITAPISPGSSGSPVVDYDGKVAGIAVGAIEAGQSLNFAVAVSELIEMLNQDEKTSSSLEVTGKEKPLNKRNPDELPSSAANGIVAIVVTEEVPSIGNGAGKPGSDPKPNPPTTSVISSPDVKKESHRIVQIGKTDLPDGTVKLALEVRDGDGKFTKLVDPKWSLNGTALPAQATVGNQREVTVKKGEHNLLVTGKTESGQDVKIEAGLKVNVEIQSAVEINQAED